MYRTSFSNSTFPGSRRGRRRGATAILAMMFLVFLSTLGLVMYSTASLNVRGAANLWENEKARATAESGLRWITWRFTKLTNPRTLKGNIDGATAIALWPDIRNAIATDLANLPSDERTVIPDPQVLRTSYIRTQANTAASNSPRFKDYKFQLVIRQHPFSPTDPLDGRYVRVSSTGHYGQAVKTVSMDFIIDKKIKHALIGKVPIQLGRNTLIEGPISMTTPNRFPPLLMLSDFRHLTTNLKNKIDSFEKFLELNHKEYDGRISVHDPVESAKANAQGFRDTNGDSYIDEYDLFLGEFDRNGDKAISESEFTNPSTGKMYDPDLFEAINKLGWPLKDGEALRPGLTRNSDGTITHDRTIDNNDAYIKLRGQATLAVTAPAWSSNLASSGNTINDMLVGPITRDDGQATPPLEFGTPPEELLNLSPSNFDTSGFRSKTGPEAGATTKSPTLIANKVLDPLDANAPKLIDQTPFQSQSIQATYQRPVFKDMTFKNVRIPKGLNALFENCTFEGVTFVELTTNVTNSSGQTTTNASDAMTWSRRMKSGNFATDKPLTADNSYGFGNGNNLRFNNCTIHGPLASDVPTAYTHFANSWEFTGKTSFDNTWKDPNSGQTTATIVAPQTNIEMGSFTKPGKAPSTLEGVVVAGNIDIRGSSTVDGSIIVTGNGAANTTLGWFGASDSDTVTNTPMPEGGYGRLNIRYNPNRPLPDGINMPIDITPFLNDLNQTTYAEGP
jgi:hypothetical protein